MRRLRRAREVVLFVHIPKTAGSTLRHLASRQDRPRSVFSTGVEEPLPESIARLQRMLEAQRRRLRLVQGNFGYGLHQLFPQAARYVTFLRGPIERAISFYHYVREENAGGRFAALGRDWPTLREFVTERLAPRARQRPSPPAHPPAPW